MSEPNNRTYTCASCHGVFETEYTEEDCRNEAIENFPDWDQEDKVVICDDCYKKMIMHNKGNKDLKIETL